MQLLFLLFYSLFQLVQPNNPVYLDQNGVTLKVQAEAHVGERYLYLETEYLIVDEKLLCQMADNKTDLIHVTLKGGTDLSYFLQANGI